MADHPVPTPAREITPEEAQARREQAYQLLEQVRASLADGRKALWSLAEALYHFDEDRAYLWLGYEALGDFLADPDIGIGRTSYFRLIRTWREFAVNRKVPAPELADISPDQADVVLPALKAGGTTLDVALADAKTLGWRDLREKYVGGETVEQPAADTFDDTVEADLPDATVEPEQVMSDDEWEDYVHNEVLQALASSADFPRIGRACLVWMEAQLWEPTDEPATDS